MFYFNIKKRKIVFDILTIFAVLLTVIAVSIVSYSFVKSKNAFLDIASNLIAQEHESIAGELTEFLMPTSLIKVIGYLVQDGKLSLRDFDSLSSFTDLILQEYPEITSIYLTDMQGNIFFETRYTPTTVKIEKIGFAPPMLIPKNTAFISQMIIKKNNQPRLMVMFEDKNREMIKQHKKIDAMFNPLNSPWFVNAKNSIDQYWIGLHQSFGLNEERLTTAYAIKHDQQFKGVVAIDINVRMIERKLQKFSKNNEKVFIITDDKKIIVGEDLLANKSIARRIYSDIKDTTNPLIIASYKFHVDSHKNNVLFDLKGVKYLSYSTLFSVKKDTQWEIVSVIPVDNFIGTLKKVNIHNTLFALAVLLLGLLFVVFSSKKISGPIIKLAEETKEITHLHFDKEIDIKTNIYEIFIMVDAINKMKKSLSSFAKYIPRALVEQLIEKNIVAQLGGEKRNVTVLFTDIANFSSLAEKLDPEYLMIHLSEYFDQMTSIIHDYHGNVDKYIGDAIMAFWGAPLDNAKHVTDACKALLACQRASNQLNDEWAKTGRPVFFTRFGLAAGEVIVGNVGSSDRLNYTVLGKTANLAARLEKINKNYGTQIIVSPIVYKKCANEFLFRPLDHVKIQGKKNPMIVYQLMATLSPNSDFAATEEEKRLCELFTRAFKAFHLNKTSDALQLFTRIQQYFPDDIATNLYIKRCQEQLSKRD